MQMNTVQYCYSTIDFLKNPHERHPIPHPLGWDMGCLLWIGDLYSMLVSAVMYVIHVSCYFGPHYNGIRLYSCLKNQFLKGCMMILNLTLLLLNPEYSGMTKLIQLLLMPRFLVVPGHQQQWYWLCRTITYFSSPCSDFISMLINDRKCKYSFMYSTTREL